MTEDANNIDNIVSVPCSIHTKKDGIFEVPDLDAWAWHHPGGVLACGHWAIPAPENDEDYEEVDVIIPMENIRYMELHLDSLPKPSEEVVLHEEQQEDEANENPDG